MKSQLFTTIKLLKKHNACEDGLTTLLASLPKSHKEDRPINLLHILESNGLDHFFWAWRATAKPGNRVKRLILHDIIKEIEHLRPDPTIFKQVLTALATGRGLDDAYAAAYAAANAAAYATGNAADNATAYAAAYIAGNAARTEADYAAYAAARAVATPRAKQIEIIKKHLK